METFKIDFDQVIKDLASTMSQVQNISEEEVEEVVRASINSFDIENDR